MRRLMIFVALVAVLGILALVNDMQQSHPRRCTGPFNGKRPTPEEIDRLLKSHAESLSKLGDAVPSRRVPGLADFCNADLRNADLKGAFLPFANFENADLGGADLHGANLERSRFDGANLREANLIKASVHIRPRNSKPDYWDEFTEIADHTFFSGANLQFAKLNGADLRGAGFVRADLSGADLAEADLRGAILRRANLSNANLEGTDLRLAKLWQAQFKLPDGKSLPKFTAFSGTELDSINIAYDLPTMQAFHELRENLYRAAMYKQEREITTGIQRAYSSDVDEPERTIRYMAFDLTCEYGSSPFYPIVLLLWGVVAFTPIYALALFTPIPHRSSSPALQLLVRIMKFAHRCPPVIAGFLFVIGGLLRLLLMCFRKARRRGGIWRIWVADRLTDVSYPNSPKPTERLTSGRFASYAFYFSLLSAFQIGWRELNLGNWVVRMQPREYILRPTGWVRLVSGLQSLLSVYLLALAMLSYFGRPFA
jgi:uncharacterized protein YjbI with pentapeptide repeats